MLFFFLFACSFFSFFKIRVQTNKFEANGRKKKTNMVYRRINFKVAILRLYLFYRAGIIGLVWFHGISNVDSLMPNPVFTYN